MLTWLGIRRKTEGPQTRQFFAGASKRTIVATLAGALTILVLVRLVLTELLPEEVLMDPLGSVLPRVIGLLTAVIVVGVVERIVTDAKP